MTHRYALLHLVCLAALLAGPVELTAQAGQPYTLDQLTRMLESGVFTDQRILFLTRENCIAFRLDEEATGQLREAGASQGLIASLGRVCVRLPRVVETVVLAPAALDLDVGESRILRARALGPDSAQISGVLFEWTSADTAVAEVSAGGVVLGKARGVTRVSAATEAGPAGTATVRVGSPAAATPAAPEGDADEGAEPETAEADTAAAGRATGKSVGTAAALGVLVPGGGEFYTGKKKKGAVVMLGAAASLAAGYLITSEDTRVLDRELAGASCQDATCDISVNEDLEIEETKQLLIGAVAAGAFWTFGLIDGIINARKSEDAPPDEMPEGEPGLAIELVPADGIRATARGDVEFTLLRIRS